MLKKMTIFIFAILSLGNAIYSQNENKDTYIFMDISGSTHPTFKEMQNYALDEILPEVKKGSKLAIYKFYEKCVNIYDQEVKTDFDIKWAEQRISKLLPNGPWTNLDLVKAIIEEQNINLESANVYILTDGHQELRDGSNEYFLTERNINSFLDDCDLLPQGGWFLLVYKYKDKVLNPVNSQNPSQIEVVEIITETKEKKQFSIDLSSLKIVIFILLILLFLILIIDVITCLIFHTERKKSVNLQQFSNHSLRWTINFSISLFAFLSLIALSYIILKISANSLVFFIFAITMLGLTILAYKLSIGDICRNITYSNRLKKIYGILTKEIYIDFANEFEIDAATCNYVLYLRRKQIEEIEFNEQEIQEKQIAFGIALKKINDSYAIGIQRFKHFYFINLEKIFEQLDLEFPSEEKRRQIADIIASSYGNDKLDKWDWILGASIGLITGLMDVFLVGKPGDSKLGDVVDKLSEKIVLLTANLNGYKGTDYRGAVDNLEKKYFVTYDKAKIDEIGMLEKNHHLLSLAHANDIIGLIFSILDTKVSIEKSKEENGALYTVVTCIYKKDPETIAKIKANPNLEFVLGGALVRLVQPLTYSKGDDIGKQKNVNDEKFKMYFKNALFAILYEKCKDAEEEKTMALCALYGFVIWLGHLWSDKIGGRSTVEKGNRGTGIAAPFQELLAQANFNIPVFRELKGKGEEIIKKQVGDITKEMFEKGFDNRFYQTQRIPVFINEYFTKIAFIIKEVSVYNKEFSMREIIQILCAEGTIKNTARAISGISNFELEKMLLVSYSTFSAIDVGDALVRSGAITGNGFALNIDTFLYINYAGLKKLGAEAVSVFLSYLRRWTSSPEKIVNEIKEIAKNSESEEGE